MNNINIGSTTKLHNGIEMPRLGLGVFQSKDGSEVINAIKYAWDVGYRLVDTASFYDNEKGVGQAIKELGINRQEIFVTSKIWNSDQGYDSTIEACNKSLSLLGSDYIDLYLVHWPVKGKYLETWKAMEELYQDGKLKAIGVSNFLQHQLEDLLKIANVVPMVNQIEYHPYLTQPALIDFCNSNNIKVQSWAPLMRGKIFEINEIVEMANRYDVSPAQLVIRWNLQNNVMVIPKSVHQDRIVGNASVFHFNISDEDMKLLNDLDRGGRIGPDPDDFDF